MAVADYPAWREYKVALARLAYAGAQVEEAQAANSPQLADAELEFQEALDA